jgi:XisH protein
MSARDIYHSVVRKALEKDHWHISHDPLRFRWGTKDVYVDLGAEYLLGADQSGKKIAVEIKSFISNSLVTDLERALG